MEGYGDEEERGRCLEGFVARKVVESSIYIYRCMYILTSS
jgi:hypothetical protein